MEMRTLRCAIEEIVDWHPHLYFESHVVACAAVLCQYSNSPAVMEVVCENIESSWLGSEPTFRLEISWSGETQDKVRRIRSTLQKKPLVEMAATALAFVITHHLAELGQMDATDYGDRADYRSIEASAVLEISGTEWSSELGRRHREKVRQALGNPHNWNAYVVVCAFSANGHRIRFSYHEAKEAADG